MKSRINILWIILLGLIVASSVAGGTGGCGNAVGTSVGNPTSPKSQAFPSGLAVASPFETVAAGSSGLTALKNQGAPFITGYEDATTQINTILNGTAPTDCLFDPVLFIINEGNAACYGPPVKYENHPDYTGAPLPAPQANGELPTGDVGIWTATDAPTGHACAAAQLNSRMNAMRNRSLAALSGLASLLCTATVNGLSLPSNGTLDLLSEMNALGIGGVSFNTAELSHSNSSGSDEYSYEMDFSLVQGAQTFGVVVLLAHRPGSSSDVYDGLLSYRITESFPLQECPTPEQTYNGSFRYSRPTAERLNVQVRGGRFCGAGTDGLTEGLVDPSKKFGHGADPDGWRGDFSILTADFTIANLVGNYSFVWQAGDGDGYTRVLDAVLSEDDSSVLGGDAFYGFGEDVETTDGAITEFFCNWAGPNGKSSGGGLSRNLAQFQSMTLDGTTGTFDAVTSNVAYAPVNACDYVAGAGFAYDRDANGTIDPEIPVSNDLIPLVDADGNEIFDTIEASGFALPTAPM